MSTQRQWQELSHGIISHNAKLLWQHEAAPADQGLAAGGPLTTPLEPLWSFRQQFGQPEQHLLSWAACLCRLSQRCCCASEWMSKSGERCNVKHPICITGTHFGVPVMQIGCFSILGSSDKSKMSFHQYFISTVCLSPPQRSADHAMWLLPECSCQSSPFQTRSPFGCWPERLQTCTWPATPAGSSSLSVVCSNGRKKAARRTDSTPDRHRSRTSLLWDSPHSQPCVGHFPQTCWIIWEKICQAKSFLATRRLVHSVN